MKFRIAIRIMFSYSNSNRTIPSNTLYATNWSSLLKCCPYYTRRKLWMTLTNSTREWGFVLFYLHLSSCRTRFILRILSLYINVIFRNSSSSFNYGSSFPWLCSSLGANVVLRGYGYYKPFICRALRWRHSCSVSMRGFCCRQRHA